MDRIAFLRNMLGFGLLSTLGCRIEKGQTKSGGNLASTAALTDQDFATDIQKGLIAAWHRSETMTMTTVGQMPPEQFTFKYTGEAMTFSEQWRHCVIYTCGQLAGRVGIVNPYDNVKLPVQMPKEDIIKELRTMYAFVRKTIGLLSDGRLLATCDFAGDTIPVWRLFYALENHIIHHRGQCVVYLRLNGVVPKGFYGW